MNQSTSLTSSQKQSLYQQYINLHNYLLHLRKSQATNFFNFTPLVNSLESASLLIKTCRHDPTEFFNAKIISDLDTVLKNITNFITANEYTLRLRFIEKLFHYKQKLYTTLNPKADNLITTYKPISPKHRRLQLACHELQQITDCLPVRVKIVFEHNVNNISAVVSVSSNPELLNEADIANAIAMLEKANTSKVNNFLSEIKKVLNTDQLAQLKRKL